ncbi:hypothetical protein ACRAWG_20370 [Methylobacterium sp. P31]
MQRRVHMCRTEQVTPNIADVHEEASPTGAATQVLGAARELALRTERLTREVGTVLSSVTAA